MYNDIVNHIKSVYPNQEFIPLHEPRFIGNDCKYVLDAIDSTFVSSVGKYVDRFEEMMRDYTEGVCNSNCKRHRSFTHGFNFGRCKARRFSYYTTFIVYRYL